MAIVVAPGQAVGQPDWEALAAQHGGTKSTTQIAPTEAQITAAGLARDNDPSFRQRPIYRYYFNDGTYVDARTAANGADYSVIDYKPSSQYKPPTAASQQKPPGGREGPEGTPTGQVDAQGNPVYDNERPRWVIRDASGTETWSRPLEPAERQQWEKERNAAAGRGSKTDAEIAAEAGKPRQSRVNPADPTKMEEFDPATGKWVDAGVNAAGVQAAEERNRPTVSTQQVRRNGQDFTVHTSTPKDGSKPTVTVYGPDGKALPGGLPAETGKVRTPVKNRPGVYEVKSQDGSNVETYYEDEAGNRVATPVEGVVDLPPGMPPLDLTNADTAHASYLAQLQWAQTNLVGKKTQKEIVDLLELSKSAAQSVIDKEKDRIANERATRTQDITLEGNRLNAATSQFANSRQGVDDAIRWGPVGGNEAANTYLTNLLVQQLMNQNTKGNVYPATGPGGPANPLPSPGAAIAPTGVPAIDAMVGQAAAAPPPPAPDMTPAPQPIANSDGSFSSPVGGVYAPGPNNYTPQPGGWFQTDPPTVAPGAPQAMADPYAGYDDAPPAVQKIVGTAIKNRILMGAA